MQFLPSSENLYIYILFWTFAGLVFIQFLYAIFFFGRLAFYKNKQHNSEFPPVSIVIAARNEADNLFENLSKLFFQDYPNEFEIVVVNNQSIDDSFHLLQAMQREHKNLTLINVEKSKHLRPSKKFPLTLGIKKAKHEHLLLTDADCSPASSSWLKEMVSSFSDKKTLILGFGPYKIEPGLLNKVIRFDSTMIGVNYLSMALNNLPYMGVGRNMGYTKSLFNSVNGFKSHYSLPSGDDDLFVQEAARKKNYTIQIEPNSFQYSDAKTTWETFVMQKTRHYSTSDRYSVFKKALLGIYPLTTILLLISFVILCLESKWRIHALIGFAFILFLKWWLLGKCFHRLKGKKFIAALPLFDLMYAIALPVFYFITKQKKNPRWK